MKKALKFIGISILILFALLLIIPFAFQSQIKGIVKQFINENVNAQVEFSDVSLSFIRSFPQAHVEVHDLVITNFKPFEGETLATAKLIYFTMSVNELFKTSSDEPIVVNSIHINETLLTLKIDALGNTNYDITKDKENTSENTEGTSNSFAFDIEDYNINNSAITYLDTNSKTKLYLTELNHSGHGRFSADDSEIDTETSTQITISIDSTTYLNNNKVTLDALIGLDLNNQKYTFKDNKGYINQLPLEFKGYVKIIEDGQDIDITFENPESSFKDFLAVIPEAYSENIENVETTGDFKINGMIKGQITEETIPTLDIKITSKNASFKYPDLPKRVSDITIDAAIKNDTGLADDTYVNINTLNFRIDDDVFKASAILKEITSNMFINADIDGTLNLENLTKAYPIEFDKQLSGILKTKLNTKFDMDAIETNTYNRIRSNGTASITNFVFSSQDIVNPIQISKAEVTFQPGTVRLNNLNAKTGTSDFSATGTLTNLLGFLLSDKKLQGNFDVNSNYFVLSDFLVEDDTSSEASNKTTSASESLKIPAFLDCKINANAKTVVYDNLNLNDVKGSLIIKDQEANLQNMTSSLFDGNLAISGKVSTITDTPIFNLNLGADGFDISKSFKGLELLQNLAPIAKALQGKLNTTINLKGTLDNEFSPNLNTVSGDAFAQLITTSIDPKEGTVLSKLENSFNFIDFSKLNLKDVQANLGFSDGKVRVKPFNLNYKDIDIVVSGSHNFDKTLDYSAVFEVPAKYLGSDVNRLIGKINDSETNKISIPVTANITGSYSNPNVKTDLSSGVSNLTKQLIEIEKQKLINKGSDQVKGLLGGLLGGDKTNDTKDSTSTKTDSTKTKDSIKEGVKGILGNILGGKKKEKDSTKN